MTKIRLFGRLIDIVLKPKLSNQKIFYEYDVENDKIIVYENNYAKLDNVKKYMLKDIFFKNIVAIVIEEAKIIKEASFNEIQYKSTQKQPIKTKYAIKEKNLSNVETYDKCPNCKANLIFRIKKQNGFKYLKCPNCNFYKPVEINSKSKIANKSKNGYYLIFSPNLLTHPKPVIISKIIFNLILTYKQIGSIEFYVELKKYSPNYFQLNFPDVSKAKELIKDGLIDKNKFNEIEQMFNWNKGE